MKTDDLLDRPDSFEMRLRDGLEHIAQAHRISEPGQFDPDMMPIAFDTPRPDRTSARALAAAAAVIATVGGLAVLATRDTSPATSNQPAQAPAGSLDETAPPQTAPMDESDSAAIDQQAGANELPRFSLSEPGWTMTHASESDQFGGSYSFEHLDGRTLDVSTIAGGEDGFAARVGDEERVVVGKWHVLDYAANGGGDVGRYRADRLRGEWTYEFDGAPFDSLDAFITTVGGVHAVEETEWQDALPDSFVSGSEQGATITELLQGVPLPDGFEVAALSDGTTNSRYQFIAHVSGAVTCAWLDQWFTGQETADPSIQQEASEALATAHDWPMLAEIANQGGWSDEVWQHADAVNGGEGVITGAGPQPPSRQEANSALDCEI